LELGIGNPWKLEVSVLHRSVTITIASEQRPDFEALLLLLRNQEHLRAGTEKWAKIRDAIRRRAEQ
jgi:hypothetical protein